MGLPLVYFRGSQVEFSKLWCISVPEDLANSADPDEICQSTRLGFPVYKGLSNHPFTSNAAFEKCYI